MNSSNSFTADTTALAVLPQDKDNSKSVLLATRDMNLLLKEQIRSIEEVLKDVVQMFPDDGKLITHFSARIVAILGHSGRISQYFADSVDYIEDMLRNQLSM